MNDILKIFRPTIAAKNHWRVYLSGETPNKWAQFDTPALLELLRKKTGDSR